VLASLHPVRGAEGIGLCRTEHMFLGERREHLQRLILAVSEEATEAALISRIASVSPPVCADRAVA